MRSPDRAPTRRSPLTRLDRHSPEEDRGLGAPGRQSGLMDGADRHLRRIC